MVVKFSIVYYETEKGEAPVKVWLHSIDKPYRARIDQRLIRISHGNLGNVKTIDSEIKEIKFDIGSGYRIYFAEIKGKIVLLLNAGDKSTQSSDIKKAKIYLENYKKGDDSNG